MFENLHSLEEYRSLFDLIWWKLEVPFYRDSGVINRDHLRISISHSLDTSRAPIGRGEKSSKSMQITSNHHRMEPTGTGWCCWTSPKTLKNGTLKVFKVDQNIKKISKEWYSQILQHKQDFHIILQLLCLPFFREKMREKMKSITFQANHRFLHFIDMPLFVGPSEVPFYRDGGSIL